jgi:hypothetical protein
LISTLIFIDFLTQLGFKLRPGIIKRVAIKLVLGSGFNIAPEIENWNAGALSPQSPSIWEMILNAFAWVGPTDRFDQTVNG